MSDNERQANIKMDANGRKIHSRDVLAVKVVLVLLGADHTLQPNLGPINRQAAVAVVKDDLHVGSADSVTCGQGPELLHETSNARIQLEFKGFGTSTVLAY